MGLGGELMKKKKNPQNSDVIKSWNEAKLC